MSWMHYTEHEIGNALEALEADGIALQQHETNPRASKTWRFPDRFEGNTALHMLAEGAFHRDRTCTLCYLLIANGALLSELNARGNTALQISVENACHHLAATLKEIAIYQSPKHRHLGREHFRDWTTASHTWCMPSAKLTALMVLLVGCSYKRLAAERGMPRLPMDCCILVTFAPVVVNVCPIGRPVTTQAKATVALLLLRMLI
eukprot:gene776-5312_t